MKTSRDRILTTHVASLPRPESLLRVISAKRTGQPYDEAELAKEVSNAVHMAVKRQVETGIDVVSDGEMSKPSFLHYAKERLTGLEVIDKPLKWYLEDSRDFRAFPLHYAEEMARNPVPKMKVTACTGPVAYRGDAQVQADIATFKAALAKSPATEAFLPSISPANIEFWIENQFYKTDEEFLTALADAMNAEYRAIVDAGLILQLDDPRLATQYVLMPDASMQEFRAWAEHHVEVMNYALRGIPAEKVRFHTCYSAECGPRTTDIELKDFVDIMMKVKAGAFSFEASNPRHEHEWKVWAEAKIPSDAILIPGVITNSTVLVEHPDLIADRILRFTDIVGKERVIAGADCGFGTFAGAMPFHEEVVWAKFEALVEGARRASAKLS